MCGAKIDIAMSRGASSSAATIAAMAPSHARTTAPARSAALVLVIGVLAAGCTGSNSIGQTPVGLGTEPGRATTAPSTPGNVPGAGTPSASAPSRPSIPPEPALTSAAPSAALSAAPVPGAVLSSLAARAEQVAGTAAPAPPPSRTVATPTPTRTAAQPFVLRLATFNVLGASHTRSKGDSKIKRGYEPRMNYAIQLLAAHQADVVGFQEFESKQARLFDQLVGPVWGLWPTAGGAGADGRNSIGYRKDTWQLVSGTSVAVPYFNGHTVHTPVALLRHRATGRSVWFISVHNAADTGKYRQQARWRRAAVEVELAAMKRLGADGTPVFLVGDMNSHVEFYCAALESGLGLTFPNPGTPSTTGCIPPATRTIDWMTATRTVTWSGYVRDRSGLAKLATDHPVYSAYAIVGSGQNQ